MLGFAPIASRPISGSSFGLTAIAAAMSATISLSLTISGNSGLVTPLSATVSGPSFSIDASWITRQAIGANISLSFDGTPVLHVAGKPIRLNALPQSFTLRARQENWTLTALPQSFTIRGAR